MILFFLEHDSFTNARFSFFFGYDGIFIPLDEDPCYFLVMLH